MPTRWAFPANSESPFPRPVDNSPLWTTSFTRRSEVDHSGVTGRPGGHAKRPAAPRGSGVDGPFPGLRAVRADGARRRDQLAAGAGLDEVEEPEPDDVDEEDVDAVDDVEGVDDDPAPTELLEDERLSVR